MCSMQIKSFKSPLVLNFKYTCFKNLQNYKYRMCYCITIKNNVQSEVIETLDVFHVLNTIKHMNYFLFSHSHWKYSL